MPKSTFNAGRLRHRITIESPELVQNPVTGELVQSWVPVAQNIAAAIEPLSAREFIAAQATQSKITARIVIRYRAGLKPNMRIVASDGAIYNPQGFLPDLNSGREYITIPCESC